MRQGLCASERAGIAGAIQRGLALAVFLLCLLAPALVQAAGNGQEVVLGMSAAFSGPSKGLGIELYRGSMACFNKVNQNGGVHGRRIPILPLDDGYNPTPAIENTQEFIDRDVLALFNYVGTPTVTRILPLLKLHRNKHFYLFFPFTGAQPQREPPYEAYVFNLRASYRQETQGLVEHFLDIGRRRIAVFYQADAYGRSGWDGVRRALGSHCLDIAAEATYARGASFATSMQPQVSIISRAKPDAVIAVGAYAACAAFIRDARDAGLEAPIANLSFVGSENLLELLLKAKAETGKDYTDRLINTQVVPSYEDTSLPAVREYRQLMDKYAPELPPEFDSKGYAPLPYSFVSFEGFFNAKVMLSVLERLGPVPERKHIPAAVASIDALDIGIKAKVDFSLNRHQGLDVVYYTTVEKGAFVPFQDWSAWKK